MSSLLEDPLDLLAEQVEVSVAVAALDVDDDISDILLEPRNLAQVLRVSLFGE